MKQNKKSVYAVLLLGVSILAFPVHAQWNPGNYASTGLPVNSIYAIIQSLLFWLLAIFGFIAVIGFVISGIMYLTSAGDTEQKEKAKKAMYYSLTGVIVGLVGLVILVAVTNLLDGFGTRF